MKIKLFQCGGEHGKTKYPLGLGYLKTNCAGADIEIVKSQKELTNCDLIGLSSSAWGLKEAVGILESTNIPVVLGGQGVLWKPIEAYRFKHIIHGDGELALQDIINGTEARFICKKAENIDDYNFPARGRYGDGVPIISSRGCPWNCAFCSSNAFWGKARYHSAEYFIREVQEIIQQYPKANVLRVLDDLFIGNIKRFNEIYELWMSLELNKKLQIKSFVRSNLLTFDLASKMKKMGFKRIRFGAESGSDKILKILNKRATVADHQRAIEIAQKTGIQISASFMHGLPEETNEDRQMTHDFIQKNKGKLKVEGWYKFQPFPGTKFYDGTSPLKTDMRVR